MITIYRPALFAPTRCNNCEIPTAATLSVGIGNKTETIIALCEACREELIAKLQQVPGCTGLTARWCPICGDCCCRENASDLDDPDCPLHGAFSRHADHAPGRAIGTRDTP